MKTTATKEQVLMALENVNKEYGYQLELNNCQQLSKKVFQFTIRSAKSGIPGARYSSTGRKLVSASWHAHGYVMDEIFEINPDCYIDSMGKRLTKGFRWEDKNVGSIINAVSFSELSIL